ncbi:MAG: TonB-dependent receptor [Glaciecola sp.]|nr:TonB-dependent receptor [Glaciecola sp.]
MNTSRILSCKILAALVCSAPVLANTQIKPESLDTFVETITVSGSHSALPIAQLAGNVSVLTEQDIARSQATFVADLLVQFAGVDISTNGGVGQFAELRLRGSETNHILVIIDGIAVNDQGQGGLVDLAHLSTQSIARIELYRGPQSALWGDGAVGGVLNIITKDGSQTDGNESALKLSVGQQNTQQAQFQHQAQSDKLQYGFTVSHISTDGQNISIVPNNNEKDGYSNTSIHSKLGYTVNKQHALNAVFHYVDYETEFDATDFVTTGLPVDADNRSQGRQQSAKLQWLLTPTAANWSLNTTASTHSNVVENTSDGQLSSLTDATTHSLSSIAKLDYSNQAMTRQFHVGASLEEIDFTQRGPVDFGDPNQTQTIDSNSVFADAVVSITHRAFINASVRYTDNSEFAAATDYRVGANWQQSAALTWFASVGQASKNPTFTERFGFYAGTFVGNPELQPEIVTTVELGLRYTSSGFNTQFNIFSAQLEDEINGFVFDSASGGFTADNIDGRSDRDGAEFEVSWSATDLAFNATYSYLDATQGSGEAQSVELRRARHNASFNTSYNWSDSISTYVSASYVGAKFDQFFPPWPQASQIIAMRPYWLINANVNIAVSKQFSVNAKIDNLLNHTYQDIVGYRGLERKAIVSMAYKW